MIISALIIWFITILLLVPVIGEIIIMNNKWILKPKRINFTPDEDLIREKSESIMSKIDMLEKRQIKWIMMSLDQNQIDHLRYNDVDIFAVENVPNEVRIEYHPGGKDVGCPGGFHIFIGGDMVTRQSLDRDDDCI